MKTFKQYVSELTIHDATGKAVRIKKQKVREIDGKIHMEYPGKSRSSER
jgi:hypothetical protein